MATAPGDGPGGTDAGSVFAEFDRRVDAWFDRLRGQRHADLAAAVLSNLSDYGFAWSLVAAAKGRRRGPSRRRATRALAVAGVSSYALNAAIKAVVQRGRPTPSGAAGGEPDRPAPLGATDGAALGGAALGGAALGGAALPVRTPTSSSFPSGHTLASFCTAVVLADGPVELVVFVGFAGAVAASRVHLRAHHPSDVLGGALIGAGLGLLDRLVVPERRAR